MFLNILKSLGSPPIKTANEFATFNTTTVKTVNESSTTNAASTVKNTENNRVKPLNFDMKSDSNFSTKFSKTDNNATKVPENTTESNSLTTNASITTENQVDKKTVTVPMQKQVFDQTEVDSKGIF